MKRGCDSRCVEEFLFGEAKGMVREASASRRREEKQKAQHPAEGIESLVPAPGVAVHEATSLSDSGAHAASSDALTLTPVHHSTCA